MGLSTLRRRSRLLFHVGRRGPLWRRRGQIRWRSSYRCRRSLRLRVRLCLRVFLCSYNFLSLLLSFLKAFLHLHCSPSFQPSRPMCDSHRVTADLVNSLHPAALRVTAACPAKDSRLHLAACPSDTLPPHRASPDRKFHRLDRCNNPAEKPLLGSFDRGIS